MAKKRKASSQKAKPSGPKELDPADARLGPVNSYEDIADSEEEYFLNRDRIMFDEGPNSKRRKRQDEEDKFLEQSDEEVLNKDDLDSEDDEDDYEDMPPNRGKPGKKGKAVDSDDEDESKRNGDGEEMDSGWWGDSKTDYYDADQIETEADALEEEAEAKKLQQKKLAKMSEEDFMFNEGDWLAEQADEDEDDEVVTEVLKDIEVTDDMTPEDRLKLLQDRYPELEYLIDEFQELQPLLITLQKEATSKPAKSVETVKYWVLGCYVAALASYFAVLTSPSRDGSETQKVMNPSELRDHEVMETLVTCREAWHRISDVKSASAMADTSALDEEMALMDQSGDDILAPGTKSSDAARYKALREEKKARKAKDKARKVREKHAQAAEESLAGINDMIKPAKKSKKALAAASSKRKAAAAAAADSDDDGEDDKSDFGEEDALDARTAADKAARKKSLRFYTSQIVQKANRRADAGRDAGGDMDIPHRERLRDRQARLNAEAERRGQKGSKYGAELGAGGDSDDEETAKEVRNAQDEDYYDMVAAKSGKKKADKAAFYEALAAAKKADRVVEQEEVGEDGKRKITYAIEKNKGLAPKRKKEVRNPRVKKKMQYEAKQKKLRSMKPVYKGPEPKGGYGGEMTGITTGLVRSRKL